MRLIVRDPALPLLVSCILLRLPVIKVKPKLLANPTDSDMEPPKRRPPGLQLLLSSGTNKTNYRA